MTRDMGHILVDEILKKFQLPSSYGLGETVFQSYFHKGRLNELIN